MGIAIVVRLSAGFDDRRKLGEYIPAEHDAMDQCANGSQHHQSQHRHRDDETAPPARPRNLIVIVIGAVSSANRDGLDIGVVAVIGRRGQEYWCSSAWQSRRPKIDLVEAELTRGGHMAGAEFSAADVQMTFPLEFAAFAMLVDARHAKLRDYLARMQARPAYRRAVDKGGAYAFDAARP
jgi:glutathione S-transferase